MTRQEMVRLRMINHKIAFSDAKRPDEVVRHLVAMQSQDFLGALWSIGLRTPGSVEADIETAIRNRTIVRTWPMRGTLHFVAPEDVRWLLKLLAPRVITRIAGRFRELELDDEVLADCRKVVLKYLKGRALTRQIIRERLENEGIRTDESRSLHILGRLAMEGIICLGPREGKQQTFVLLDEWIPEEKKFRREEALEKLTLRYFTGHGPAGLKDFMWWSGLTLKEAKEGLELVKHRLISVEIDGVTYYARSIPSVIPESPDVYFLSGFDEYLLGYTDRTAVIDVPHRPQIHPGANGMFLSTMVKDGRVFGLWRRDIKTKSVHITPKYFTPQSAEVKRLCKKEAERYGAFIGFPATFST